jgi:hypothetical protein
VVSGLKVIFPLGIDKSTSDTSYRVERAQSRRMVSEDGPPHEQEGTDEHQFDSLPHPGKVVFALKTHEGSNMLEGETRSKVCQC